MRLRSLSVAILAGVVLVPVSASAATAGDAMPRVSGMAKTYKTSEAKRVKRAARLAAAKPTVVQAPRTTYSAPAPAPVAPAPVVTGPVATASYQDRVLALTNAQRTSRGLRALRFSSCANGFADSWAGKLAAAGSLSHQALSPILSTCGARGVGENVAYGNVSPEQLVQMWMDSAGHRANILNPAYTHLGVGDVTTSNGRVYGVQVFLTL
ncbi:MAG: hypothetical protein JWM62_958 [Frankiales bacterium]|jgi:uncharacterized protein YkwD|nr:hypothetical protein [Frankiales bacterium]